MLKQFFASVFLSGFSLVASANAQLNLEVNETPVCDQYSCTLVKGQIEADGSVSLYFPAAITSSLMQGKIIRSQILAHEMTQPNPAQQTIAGTYDFVERRAFEILENKNVQLCPLAIRTPVSFYRAYVGLFKKFDTLVAVTPLEQAVLSLFVNQLENIVQSSQCKTYIDIQPFQTQSENGEVIIAKGWQQTDGIRTLRIPQEIYTAMTTAAQQAAQAVLSPDTVDFSNTATPGMQALFGLWVNLWSLEYKQPRLQLSVPVSVWNLLGDGFSSIVSEHQVAVKLTPSQQAILGMYVTVLNSVNDRNE